MLLNSGVSFPRVSADVAARLALPSLLDLISYFGLAGVTLATLLIAVGLLIAVRYSPVRSWPHRQFNIFLVHRGLAYLLLLSIALHVLCLLWLKTVHFRLLDILLPLWSPQQPVENTLGAVAVYLLAAVLLTSYYRLAFSRRVWKRIHLLAYPSAALLYVHGIFTNQNLDGRRVDYLDGEKVFIEGCFLMIVVLAAWMQRRRKKREERLRGPSAPQL